MNELKDNTEIDYLSLIMVTIKAFTINQDEFNRYFDEHTDEFVKLSEILRKIDEKEKLKWQYKI